MRTEAAPGSLLSNDLPGADGVREAAQRHRTEIAILEQVAHKPPGSLGDDNSVGFCDRLQSRREVGCFSKRRLLSRSACIHELADDHQTRRDSDPHAQTLRENVELGDVRDERKRCTHGALGAVFKGLGIAKIDQRTVSHEAGDEAAEALNGVGDASVVGADYLPQFLRVEPRRHRRGADEIAEQDGQLPSFDRRKTAGPRPTDLVAGRAIGYVVGPRCDEVCAAVGTEGCVGDVGKAARTADARALARRIRCKTWPPREALPGSWNTASPRRLRWNSGHLGSPQGIGRPPACGWRIFRSSHLVTVRYRA